MAELRTNADGSMLCTSEDGTYLITSEDDSCVCEGGPPCDWWYRAIRCSVTDCNVLDEIYIRCDARCNSGGLADGYVIVYKEQCWILDTDVKWTDVDPPPPGYALMPIGAHKANTLDFGCFAPGQCDQQQLCLNAGTHYQIVPCDCNPDPDGVFENAYISCAEYRILLESGFPCPTLRRSGICAHVDPYKLKIPPSGSDIYDAAAFTFRTCCECCTNDCPEDDGCTHVNQAPIDPGGWHNWAGLTVPTKGPCCCGSGASYTITATMIENNRQTQRVNTFTGTATGGRCPGSGIWQEHQHTEFDDGGIFDDDTSGPSNISCWPAGSFGGLPTATRRLAAFAQRTLHARYGCNAYKHEAYGRTNFGNGQLAAEFTSTVVVTFYPSPGQCDDCSEQPVDGDGEGFPPPLILPPMGGILG